MAILGAGTAGFESLVDDVRIYFTCRRKFVFSLDFLLDI